MCTYNYIQRFEEKDTYVGIFIYNINIKFQKAAVSKWWTTDLHAKGTSREV